MATQRIALQHGQSMSRVAGACPATAIEATTFHALSAYPSPTQHLEGNFDVVWNLSGKRPSRVALT